MIADEKTAVNLLVVRNGHSHVLCGLVADDIYGVDRDLVDASIAVSCSLGAEFAVVVINDDDINRGIAVSCAIVRFVAGCRQPGCSATGRIASARAAISPVKTIPR